MKKLILFMLFGSFGIAQAATSNDLKEEKALENPYIYEYGYGAVDTPNGTCYVYGKYVILAEDTRYYSFQPTPSIKTAGMEPICFGEGEYLA